ncbi:MAG TPA: FAD-dependent oxidoreductase [Candidatus Bathyarchaeia archaeon]|nr:FAD-dependent oxidoreductase [Candidatus Bathyarchaeia archaeon]
MATRRRFLRQIAGAAVAGAAATHGSANAEEKPAPGQVAWKRRVPIRYEADVAVAGGGIAGVTAAIAAARSGARVLLVERFGVTGGNATVGGVGSFCGETAGQGAVFDDIVAALEAFGAIAPYKPYVEKEARVFDPEILAVVLQELLLKSGVRLLLHTQFVDAVAKDGRIRECIVCGSGGPEAIRASQYIDCTGEAALAHAAGFETVKGRPEDGLQLPMSMMFTVRHVGDADRCNQVPENWFDVIRSESGLPMTSIWPNGPGSNAIKVKIPMFDASDTESLTAAEVRARRRMMEILDYYQRVENKPWLLDHAAARIGIRESRRVMGEYVLKLEDLRAGRAFDDAIARGVFYLDGHDPTNDKRTYILPPEQRRVPPYQIPFRSLIPQGSRNLLVAGRCFSADQLALSSARVMTTCAMMGQAAGIGAAMAAKTEPIVSALNGADVRRAVEKNGAVLAVG